VFSQLLTPFIPKFQQMYPPVTELIGAKPLFHANSCLQDENHRAAVVMAADRLNNGVPQTGLLAVEPGFPATGGFREKPLSHPGERWPLMRIPVPAAYRTSRT